MTDQTLLAAVHAAANDPASIPDAAANQETNMTTQDKGPAAAPALTTITTLAQMQAAFPSFCSELSTSATAAGALAERQRILSLDALPSKGHDKLLAELKADGKSTAADGALAILTAEKATREKQSADLAGVETETGKVTHGANEQGGGREPKLEGEAGMRAEFAKDKALQAEFGGNVESYVAYKTAEDSGRVRRLHSKTA